MTRKILYCLVFILMLTSVGCSYFETKQDLPAEELAEKGMLEFEKGDYQDAINHFENLRDWYPFNRLAILAELKIADAYFNIKKYDDAIFAYEEFENLHPRNEAAPYCVYKIGMGYFNQQDTVDRDQTLARKALETFDRLLETYPETEYAKKARVLRKKSLKSLASHEIYVAKFYLKQKLYEAALKRFEGVIKKYPDVGMHNEALHYIAMLRDKLNKTD